MHYGSEQPDFETIIHFPTSEEGSERASERMSAAERASKPSRAEQANERFKRMDETVAQYFSLDYSGP